MCPHYFLMKGIRKDLIVKFRVNKKEKELLKQLANKSDSNISNFARKKLLGDLLK